MPKVASGELSFCGGTLLLTGLSQAELERVLPDHPFRWDDRVSGWRADALDYERLVRALRRGVELNDLVPAWIPVTWPEESLHVLRPDQAAAVQAWQATRRGVVVMPTGTGKTEVALTVMARSRVSTLVVAPVRDLMYQWHRRIQAGLGYDAGIIGDSCFQVRPVSVTTYDSASIHMQKLGNQFGLLVYDECHHLPGGSWRQESARMSAAPWRLGLTATLERGDGRHVELDQLIGPLAYRQKLSQARGRTLARYEICRIVVHLSEAERQRYDACSEQVRSYVYQRRQEDPAFQWEDLCRERAVTPDARQALAAYWTKQSIEDRAAEKLRVLEDLFRLHAGEKCIVFAGSNAMARDVSRRFLIPCLLNHCGKEERRTVLAGLADGTFPALVANQVLDEGVDLPAAKVGIVIGGSSSTRQAQQRLGRILRKSGSAEAIMYEIVCAETNEVRRSRQRRRNDAYQTARHRRT